MDVGAALREALDGGRARIEFISGFRHLLGRGRSCPRHAHRDVELVFHPSGNGSTSLADGSSVSFGPGAVVLYPATQRHGQTLDTAGVDLCLHVAFAGRGPGVAGVLTPNLVDPRLRREFEDLTTTLPPADPLAQAALDHRATALLCSLAAPQGSGSDHAQQASDYIAREYGSIARIDDVAKAVGLSGDHLRHCFTARYGIGPGQWLLRVRCDRARDLLARSELPLAAVATECGFRSLKHFSAAFQRTTGVPPMRWRRQHRPAVPYTDRPMMPGT
jgi:AraC-like DNA-binding protein